MGPRDDMKGMVPPLEIWKEVSGTHSYTFMVPVYVTVGPA